MQTDLLHYLLFALYCVFFTYFVAFLTVMRIKIINKTFRCTESVELKL